MTKVAPTRRHRRPRAGDIVLILFDEKKIRATVLEDRGPLGVGGRRIYRVQIDFEQPLIFELPGEEIELAPESTAEAPAVT